MSTRLSVLVAKNIKAERARRDLYQDAVATALGVSISTVADIESGRRPLRLDELIAVCAALDIPLSTLFQGLSPEEKAVLGL